MYLKVCRKSGASLATLLVVITSILVQVNSESTKSSLETETTTTSTLPEPPITEDDLENLDERPLERDDNGESTSYSSPTSTPRRNSETKRLFVMELLRMLHEQYHHESTKSQTGDEIMKKEDRQLGSNSVTRQSMMAQLLSAIGADGDMKRLIDWAQNSFNLASIGELTTQFVVSKLGSVNCAAILKPDKEETLIPRFLLFNDHFVDVPFELSIKPNAIDCLANGRFDPQRKTVVLIHGYLTGYTLVDGLTNIKNRLLDTNKLVRERAMSILERLTQETTYNTTRLFVEDIEMKLKTQQYNVIIVDWFNGANPVPRSRYIRASVNAQVVGQLIARFLAQIVSSCQTSASNIQIIAHSLGCHVAGFTGKAMIGMGHKLGKITHLDPVGLCFGRLFSEPRFRLSPNDAIETQAVHVSLNLFDNPLDGAQSNFLVNGGRDQIGCGGQSELRNSTTSSVALLYDSDAKFRPCSHLRVLALYEDDMSSEPGQCQLVGYRCPTYEKFLAGKCGRCDAMNGQCRLMSMPPIIANFKTVPIANVQQQQTYDNNNHFRHKQSGRNSTFYSAASIDNNNKNQVEDELLGLVNAVSNGSIAWLIDDKELNEKIVSTIMNLRPSLVVESKQQQQQQSTTVTTTEQYQSNTEYNNNEIRRSDSDEIRRSDRRLSTTDQRDKLVQAIEKIRTDTRNALTEGLLGFRSAAGLSMTIEPLISGEKYKSLSRLRGKYTTTNSSPQAKPTRTTNVNIDQILADPEILRETFSPDPIPLGGQAKPEGSVNMPLYFLGTGPISPYCVNYYQFRMLIAESRMNRLLKSGNLAPNRGAQVGDFATSIGRITASGLDAAQRQATNERDTLHLTIKLTDSNGHFFKGFTLVENARTLTRVPSEVSTRPTLGGSENMVELTMLLNTTRPEPVHISESIVSFYFHGIVLADTIEINYMSNISPLVRARYSSMLCPLAINDRHQLVKYVECNKLAAKRRWPIVVLMIVMQYGNCSGLNIKYPISGDIADDFVSQCFYQKIRNSSFTKAPELHFFSSADHNDKTLGCKETKIIELNLREDGAGLQDNPDNWLLDLEKIQKILVDTNSYNKMAPSYVIVHGFMSNWDGDNWMCKLKDKILNQTEANVFIVDWSGGAKPMLPVDYDMAVTNTKYVGQLLAKFILNLLQLTGQKDASKFHIIGHSLGAHISGFVGYALGNTPLGRITGLDPAGPCFTSDAEEQKNNMAELRETGELKGDRLRLSAGSANLVMAIHTDATKFGLNENCGHYDIYVNGGSSQPVCVGQSALDRVDNLLQGQVGDAINVADVVCSHGVAHQLTEAYLPLILGNNNPAPPKKTRLVRAAIPQQQEQDPANKKCCLMAHRCGSWKAYVKGECGLNSDISDISCIVESLALDPQLDAKKLAQAARIGANENPQVELLDDAESTKDDEYINGEEGGTQQSSNNEDNTMNSSRDWQHFIKTSRSETSICAYSYQMVIATERGIDATNKLYVDIPLEQEPGLVNMRPDDMALDRLVQVSHKLKADSWAHEQLSKVSANLNSDQLDYYTALITFDAASDDECKNLVESEEPETNRTRWYLCESISHIDQARLWSTSDKSLGGVKWVAMVDLSGCSPAIRHDNSYLFMPDMDSLEHGEPLDGDATTQMKDGELGGPTKKIRNTVVKGAKCLWSKMTDHGSACSSPGSLNLDYSIPLKLVENDEKRQALQV